jgi:hypothetical protein
MMRLGEAAQRAARRYLLEEARAVERAAYLLDFEGGSGWALVDALQPYQNPDGGFGHALEPDLRCPQSSPLATAVALHRLAEAGVAAGHPSAVAAVRYLQAQLDPVQRVWRIVPEAAEEAPRAPWFAAAGLAERFFGCALNPKADLVAQLYRLGPAADESWLDALAEEVVRTVEVQAASGLEMHEVIGVAQLLDAPHLSPGLRRRLFEQMVPIAEGAIGRTPEAWAGYGLKPLALAPHPQAALAGVLADAIEQQLDHLLATQGAEGAWWPQWSWGEGGNEAVWAQSARTWAGMLTLEALRQLRAYGRLAL